MSPFVEKRVFALSRALLKKPGIPSRASYRHPKPAYRCSKIKTGRSQQRQLEGGAEVYRVNHFLFKPLLSTALQAGILLLKKTGRSQPAGTNLRQTVGAVVFLSHPLGRRFIRQP